MAPPESHLLQRRQQVAQQVGRVIMERLPGAAVLVLGFDNYRNRIWTRALIKRPI